MTIVEDFNFFLMEHGSYQNEKRRYEENSEFSNLFEFFILIYQLEIYIIIHFMQLVKIRWLIKIILFE